MTGTPSDDAPTLVEDEAEAQAPSPIEPLPTGGTIGRFVVLEELGRGGMGVVVRAYDPKLQREVALKAIQPNRVTRTNHARMVREARAMAKLSHPNVVAVHDVEIGPHGSAAIFLVMEYVAGGTLGAWLNDDHGWQESLELLLDAGRGLHAAHEAGLLHRDFKPDNVMVGEDGRVRVTDFGLARAHRQPRSSLDLEEGSGSEDGMVSGEDPEHLHTEAGLVLGTPVYMPPEQHAGDELTAKADQYAFCVVAWEALAGVRPFSGRQRQLKAAKKRGPPDWPAGLDVPARIGAAIRRGLHPEPQQRWPDMAALMEELDEARMPRERSTAMIVALVGLGALGVGGVVWTASADAPCSGAAAELATAWNDERRAAAQTAVLGSGVRYAPGVWERVVPRIDTYAEQWEEQYTEACRATHVRKEQSQSIMDSRVRCLMQARRELDAATSLFAEADQAVVERAYDVVGGLPDLDRCADVVALESSVPLPDDDEAQTVAELRDEAARAKARSRAGKYDDAVERYEAILARAHAIRYEPVRTEILSGLGLARDGRGDYVDAEKALQAALQNAVVWEQWERAQEAAALLMVVSGLRQGKYDAALAHAVTAEALLHKLGDPDPIHGAFRDNFSSIYYAKGEYELAREQAERAVALFERSLGPDDSSTIQAINDLAATLHYLGRSDEAVPMFRKVVEAREKELGLHPWVGLARNNLGGALSSLGRHEEAQRELKAAVEIIEQTLGEEHPMLGTTHSMWGTDFEAQGKHEEAQQQFRRAIEVLTSSAGADHPQTLVARSNLGGVLLERERYDEARAALVAVLRSQEESQGFEHPESVKTRHRLIQTLLALELDDEALPLLRRQWSLASEPRRQNDRRWGFTAWWLAEVLQRTRQDEPGQIDELVAESIRFFETAKATDQMERVRAWSASRSGSKRVEPNGERDADVVDPQ